MSRHDRGVVPIRERKNTAIVAIGANLIGADGSTPLQTCRRAAADLGRLPGWRLVKLSRWYRTIPDPPLPGAPPFVNGAGLLDGATGMRKASADSLAVELLAALHALEDGAGRVRSVANAPRTLDLDLIALDELDRTAAPILPHPRAHLRRFVLQPLADVCPGWRHPRLGRTVEELLADLPDADLPEPLTA